MGEEGKSGVCSKTTKGTPTEGASALCKGKGVGRRKKVKEGRRGRGSMCGQATRSAARIEEKFGGGIEKESRGTLWKESTGRGMPIRIRMVHKGSDSFVPNL